MSSTQKKLVQSTWSHLTTSFTFEIIGTLLFKSLFKTTPSAVSIFPFSREYMEAGSDVNSRLYTSPRFLEHAAKVIGAVDLAVKSLDDLEVRHITTERAVVTGWTTLLMYFQNVTESAVGLFFSRLHKS